MEIRPATTDDADEIVDVATRAIAASYTLSPATIEGAVDGWFSPDALSANLADEAYHLLVADDDGILGLAEGTLQGKEPVGEINWVLVDPEERGGGIGGSLFERIRERLLEAGAETIRATVLADNQEGPDFYREFGFEPAGDRTVEIEGTVHTERVFVDIPGEEPPARLAHDGLKLLEDEGTEVYVDFEDRDIGSIGSFHRVYTDLGREERYGFFCGNCDSMATAMDAMGRIECSTCGNARKPTRWDAAYL